MEHTDCLPKPGPRYAQAMAEESWRWRHRECGPDCCITGDRCEDDTNGAPERSGEVASLHLHKGEK